MNLYVVNKIFAFLLALCVTFALTGCGASASGADAPPPDAERAPDGAAGEADGVEAGPKSPVDGRTVAWIDGGSLSEAARREVLRYAAEWGLTLTLADEPGGSAEEQRALVERAVADGVDGICLRAADASALDAVLREARAKGIGVVTWEKDVSSDARALAVSRGTASMLGALLVDMGASALEARGLDPEGAIGWSWRGAEEAGEEDELYDAARAYIEAYYPNWNERAEPPAELILCGDGDALLGQCEAMAELGLTAEDLTATGFCLSPDMLGYLESGVCARWGAWDRALEGAMGCYLAARLAEGAEVRAGDIVNIPRVGSVEVLPGGVVALPEHIVLTAGNAAEFHF